ncbi:MAG: flagellar biosynthesis protein FlhB [Phycisphaerae bacterium]|nr:flagellar biosynthesis protein FlhB [Phycisphaerae bacterium]
MPDDRGDKTEPATPRRRTEARQRGQVAKSTDLSSALLLVGGMLCMRLCGPWMMASLMNVMKEHLAVGDPASAARLDVVAVVSSIGLFGLAATGPILLGLVLLAVVSNLLQVGLLFTSHPLQPKADKLNPINGFKRLFSSKTLIQLVMNLLKLAVVGSVAYLAIADRKDDILLAMEISGWPQVVLISKVLYEVGFQLAAVLLVLALFDFAWQRYKHEKDLKMSKQEVKEELRRMEGDPIVKRRRLQMQYAAAIQRIRSSVPTADVVVTNPTELAVAIKYDAESMQAPKVVAKGQNLLARRIREIAIANRIPIVERKPLAQALFKMVEVGQEIPEQFYKAVAEILAYVYELSGRSPRRKPATAA